jgi:hypothetical protein
MSFERKLHLGLNSKECHFSTEMNFERTTDEFRKNVIRSNDLARLFPCLIQVIRKDRIN